MNSLKAFSLPQKYLPSIFSIIFYVFVTSLFAPTVEASQKAFHTDIQSTEQALHSLSMAAKQQENAVGGFQAPCPPGTRAGVTTWHSEGSQSRWAYDWICSAGDAIYSPQEGSVAYSGDQAGETQGMIMIYNASRDVCLMLIHLDPTRLRVKTGDQVSKGQYVAHYTSSQAHVHIAVNPGRCSTYSHANEIPMIYDEIGYILSQRITSNGSHAQSEGARVWVTVSDSPAPTAPPYAYKFISQNVPPGAMTAGGQRTISFRVENVGTETWTQDIVRLGTDRPNPGRDDASPFYAVGLYGWQSPNRIKMKDESVAPGQQTTFEASFRAPDVPSEYHEYFRLVADGIGWMDPVGGLDVNPSLNFKVTVNTRDNPGADDDIFGISNNCQYGTSGNYCLDKNIGDHKIKAKMEMDGSRVKVTIEKYQPGTFRLGGSVRVYDNDMLTYISRLEAGNGGGVDVVAYGANASSIVFWIAPDYLGADETHNIAIHLSSDDGNGMYIDYFTLKRQTRQQPPPSDDTYQVRMNCQNGSTDNFCLDTNRDDHKIKATMTEGVNSAGIPYIKVTIQKYPNGTFGLPGNVQIYDNNLQRMLDRLDASSNVTARKDRIYYNANGSSVEFYLDPSYLNLNAEHNIAIHLHSSNKTSMYIDYFALKRTRTQPAGLPDIQIQRLSLTRRDTGDTVSPGGRIPQGTTIQVQVTTKNCGQSDVNESFSLVYRDNNQVVGTDTEDSSVEKGCTDTGVESHSWPLSGVGKHKIEVCVDTDSQIAESNEQNNCETVPVQVYEELCYTLAVQSQPSAGGTVTIQMPPNCNSNAYKEDTVVPVQMQTYDGYTFQGWSGSATGSSQTVYVRMDANKSVTGHFNRLCYTLNQSVAPENSGLIQVQTPPNCDSSSYTPGTIVSTLAVPADGFQFVAWSGAANGSNQNVQITMDANKHIQAEFEQRPTTTSVPLQTGWNLISLPRRPVDSAVEQVLASVMPDVEKVFAMRPCDDGGWKLFDSSAPGWVNDLHAVDESLGFWVKMKAEGTLSVSGEQPTATSIPLCTGWNLVGFPKVEPTSVADAMISIQSCYTRIFTHKNGEWLSFDPSRPLFANDLTVMEPGQGYWIKATRDCTWTVQND